MAEPQVKVIGRERLAATMRFAVYELENLDGPAREASAVAAARGRANAPRRTGRLANSVQALSGRGGDGGAGSSLVYAPVIHNGWYGHNIAPNPFLARALEATTGQVTAIYGRGVNKAIGHVKGA